MKTRTTTLQLFVALLFAAALSVQTVHAATITVMNTNDSGAGSLRQALADASDGDTIDFAAAVSGTITLTSGQLVVGKSVMISGPGANVLAIDGNHASSVFQIDQGLTVTISGLTITNGSGVGINNDHSTLTVSDSTLSGNSGNGILNYGAFTRSAMLTVTNSTLSGNSASNAGGGIYNDGAINGNAMLRVTNSTLSGNSAPSGGGIYNDGTNSGSATLTINNSTLSGNSASASGGGISNDNGLVTLVSTILNAGASGANIDNVEGTVMSNGFNLSSDDASAFLNQLTDQNSTDPKLGPLRDNGGPTFTHGLFTGSPAIDKGANPLFLLTDQRGPGFPRVIGVETDVGAFEGVQPLVCPQGQGYWKNNPAAWPVTSLTLGGMTYSKSVLLKILGTPVGKGPKADASLILADQLIAAKLNIANGTDGTPVSSTIMNADSLLTGHPVGSHVKPSSSIGQAMVNDANVLNNFNNGLLTLGCGL